MPSGFEYRSGSAGVCACAAPAVPTAAATVTAATNSRREATGSDEGTEESISEGMACDQQDLQQAYHSLLGPEDLQRARACDPTAHDGTGLEHHLHVVGVHSFAQPTKIKSLIADRGQAINAAMAT
jgi:hypothetical protein